MNLRNLSLSFAVFLMSCLSLWADHWKIERLSTAEGLPSNTVNDLMQDETGYLWMATSNGLCRYDGYNFITFEANPQVLRFLQSNHVYHLVEDRQNHLMWIFSFTGVVSCYDLTLSRFVNYLDGRDPRRHYAKERLLRNGILLYDTDYGIRWVNYNKGKFTCADFSTKDHTISTNIINDITEDDKCNVWIGTPKGLYEIVQTGELHRRSAQKKVLALTYAQGQIYTINNGNEICSYRPTDGRLVQSFKIPIPAGRIGRVTAHFIDDDRWVIFSNEGSISIDLNKASCTRLQLQPQNITLRHEDAEQKVLLDGVGNFYVFSQHQFVFRKNLFENPEGSYDPRKRISVSKSISGDLYISTTGNGIFVYHPTTKLMEHIGPNNIKTGLMNNVVNQVFCDRNGIIWATSEYGGIYKITHYTQHATTILPNSPAQGIRANSIREIAIDKRGRILFSTKSHQLFNFDEVTNLCTPIGKYDKDIYAYFVDSRNRVWIGTKGDGFYVDDKNYRRDKQSWLWSDEIYDIVEDKRGRVWLATFGGGVVMAETRKDGTLSFQCFRNGNEGHDRVHKLLVDAQGWLWIACNEGIQVVNSNRSQIRPGDFINYNMSNGRLPEDEVIALMSDSKHRIWIGSFGKGVGVTPLPTDYHHIRFKWTSRVNGLPNDNVRSLIEDYKGNVWVGTEQGVARISGNDAMVTSYENLSDDIIGNVYSDNSVIRLSNGDLLFGTSKGLMRMTPQQDHRPGPTMPRITDVLVNGQSMTLADSMISVKETPEGKEITLSYHQNTLTFCFSNMNFAHKALYVYRLEGVDGQWSEPISENSVVYSNLRPGTYRFAVRALVGNGQWIDGKKLTLRIEQPWWNSWWMRTISLLFLLTIGVIMLKMILNNLELREDVRVEKRLTEFRLDFFTHIAHEFRTPVAIIEGAAESVEAADSLYHAKSAIKTIRRGSNRLLRLVNSLLQFRKVSTGQMRLQVEEADVIEDLQRLYLDFRPMAETKRLNLVFTPFTRHFLTVFDREKIETIVYNLLSNAIKYTPEHGRVTVYVRHDEVCEQLSVIVEDNGAGIHGEQAMGLFKPFMHGHISQGGMGIGLYMAYQLAKTHHGDLQYRLADGGQGSVFTLSVPTGRNAYSPNDYRLAILAEDSLPATTDIQAMTVAPESLNNVNVFIVEDDADLLAQLTQLMSVYFSIRPFSNGQEAFEAAVADKPALIISDVMLPGMSGFEMTSKLKGNAETTSIKIVLLTALSTEDSRLKGIEAAADDYFVKPCPFRLLLARCFKLIEQAQTEQKLHLAASNPVDAGTSHTVAHTPDKLVVSIVDKNYMDKVTTIVSQHMSDPNFNVEQLIEHLGQGRTATFARIRELFDMTPNEYIREMRLQMAAKLLLEGELNVSEVAMAVGINDASYFNRRFKLRFGVPASKYGRSVT